MISATDCRQNKRDLHSISQYGTRSKGNVREELDEVLTTTLPEDMERASTTAAAAAAEQAAKAGANAVARSECNSCSIRCDMVQRRVVARNLHSRRSSRSYQEIEKTGGRCPRFTVLTRDLWVATGLSTATGARG